MKKASRNEFLNGWIKTKSKLECIFLFKKKGGGGGLVGDSFSYPRLEVLFSWALMWALEYTR